MVLRMEAVKLRKQGALATRELFRVSVKTLNSGNCPENWTNAQCVANGLDGGSMHRTDSYRESNVVLELRDAEVRCKANGLSGRALAIEYSHLVDQ